jgi:dihydropteroate synthase
MTPDRFRSWLRESDHHPLVMGILNITPDSFSDGGKLQDVSDAADLAREMVDSGASILDIGGESTRPGAARIGPDDQIKRVMPVVHAIARLNLPVTMSVDTTLSDVAEAALDAGATFINDISAGQDDPRMLSLTAARQVPIVLMHMQGPPATMQVAPSYSDVTREVIDFLKERIGAAITAGIDPADILVDPGIGFGKTVQHNLQLLRRLNEISDALGRPVVLGTSRKGFIGHITGEDDPSNRLFGTAATIAWGIANGARVLRVHDVRAMSQVTRMIDAIQSS